MRSLVAHTIRDAGIIDASGREDSRYPLRCPKCSQRGHNASQCVVGDALDQLDRAAGWTEPAYTRRTVMPVRVFEQVKIAFSHQLPEHSIATHLTVALDEVKRAVLAKTYANYAG